jgi:hypothetical protein
VAADEITLNTIPMLLALHPWILGHGTNKPIVRRIYYEKLCGFDLLAWKSRLFHLVTTMMAVTK